MRNRRLFVFIIGLEILLQNMANNNICQGRCRENKMKVTETFECVK